jgi:hypothetical protein
MIRTHVRTLFVDRPPWQLGNAQHELLSAPPRLRAEAEGACGHVAGGLILASGDPNDTRVKVGPGAIGGIDLLDEGEVAGGKRPAVRLVCVDAPHPDPE